MLFGTEKMGFEFHLLLALVIAIIQNPGELSKNTALHGLQRFLVSECFLLSLRCLELDVSVLIVYQYLTILITW